MAVAISTEMEEAFEEARAAANAAVSSSCDWIKLPHHTSRENSSKTSFMFPGLICKGSHQRSSILICRSAISSCREDKLTNYVVGEKDRHREFSTLLHLGACDTCHLHFFPLIKSPPSVYCLERLEQTPSTHITLIWPQFVRWLWHKSELWANNRGCKLHLIAWVDYLLAPARVWRPLLPS